MNRREYLAASSVLIAGTVTGCLSNSERSTPRPYGETQHRNNVAMAATVHGVTGRIQTDAQTYDLPPDKQFALIRFWAENLVASRRTLPPKSTTELRIDDTTYTVQLFEDWNRRYEGGEVDAGVLRHGLVPFEIPEYDSNPDVTFQVSGVDGFPSSANWTGTLESD